MSRMDVSHHHFLKYIVISFILYGCSTVSYDSQADQQLEKITQEINLQLITWQHQAENTPVPYSSEFYDKVESDISSLEIRMEAASNSSTDKLVSIFESLNDQLETMRSLHKKTDPLPSTYFYAERILFNKQLAPLQSFEQSLKNSSSSSAGNTSSTATATTSKKAAALQ